METEIKTKILNYLELQKKSYETSLNNKVLNNRLIKKSFVNARTQIENALRDITDLIEKVKEL